MSLLLNLFSLSCSVMYYGLLGEVMKDKERFILITCLVCLSHRAVDFHSYYSTISYCFEVSSDE